MLTAGTLLQNRYHIKRPLAQGGMGAVYEAEAIHLGRTIVAVKETFFTEAFLREQFEREAATLARLRHPALPKVTDHFSEGTGQFLVMEFIPGKDLLESLTAQVAAHGAPFAWEQVCEWADRLLDALEYIHNQAPPVIHRDIKPQNLKLTPQGEIILLDFGLVKDATTPTHPGGSLRAYTAEYAPPEQLKFTGTDGRADLFALSATLYHLMTGEPPVSAKVREEVMEHSMPDPLRPAHQRRAGIPFGIAAVLARALALDRERRYATAKDMRQALKLAQQELAAGVLEEQGERERQEAERRQHEAESARQQLAVAESQQQAQQRQKMRQQEEAAQHHAKLAMQLGPTDLLDQSAPARRKGSGVALIVVSIAALFVATLGGVAYWFWMRQPPTVTSSPQRAPVAVAEQRVEVLRYALERKDESGRVASLDLAEGKSFKLHFTPRQSGYLYLLAPDENERLATFLTAQRLEANADFAFPPTWISFSAASKRVPVTVVFAEAPITRLNFLTQANQTLTTDQRQAFDVWRELAATAAPQTKERDGTVTVDFLPKGQPLVFDIVFARGDQQ